MTERTALFLTAFLCGCPSPKTTTKAETQTPSPAISPSAEPATSTPLQPPVQLGLFLEVWRKGVPIKPPDDPLRMPVLSSGDQFNIQVLAEEPTYIYVFSVDAKKTISPIYGDKDRNFLTANVWTRIPALPEFFFADKQPGDESLLIIASRSRPLSVDALQKAIQPEFARLSASVAPASSANLPPPAGRPKPPNVVTEPKPGPPLSSMKVDGPGEGAETMGTGRGKPLFERAQNLGIYRLRYTHKK